jgi:hypothetical protein
MTFHEIKNVLKDLQKVQFQLPNGTKVPDHFHVTEVGTISKNFMDCGGTLRKEEVISFQLWSSFDYDHRLKPDKLIHIMELSERVLNITDREVEVEYQGETIQKFGVYFNGESFVLVSKQTDCLAKDNCGIPTIKPKVKLSDLKGGTCTPDGGCC